MVESMFKRNEWRLKRTENLDEDKAATMIQSGFRGRKSRGRVKKIQRSKDLNFDDAECVDAAIKMQVEMKFFLTKLLIKTK